ncbi:MAG: acyl-CoA dehydrogenase family protein, partial [Caldimonas sp.]
MSAVLADDDRRLVAESAAAFVADHGSAARARVERAAGALDETCWQGMAALGWFGIDVPEAAGGLGLGPMAVCVVAEAAGRGLLMPPLTQAMAAAALLGGGEGTFAARTLDSLLGGRAFVALARAVPSERDTGPAGGLVLRRVPDGDLARAFVVATGDGDTFETRLVDRAETGAAPALERCVDGSWLASLEIAAATWAAAPMLGRGTSGEVDWEKALALFRLGDAAYSCGLMATTLAMSLDYLRLRRQFGAPIGSFQALQHRAVDGHVGLAAARALVFESARARGTPREAWAAAASVRRATAAALAVTRENIQFHGAIGFADEHDA